MMHVVLQVLRLNSTIASNLQTIPIVTVCLLSVYCSQWHFHLIACKIVVIVSSMLHFTLSMYLENLFLLVTFAYLANHISV